MSANLRGSVLCSDMAVKQIDEPFILGSDDRNEWAL
jgi:vacuolar protein sorting-associated protein 18